MLLYYKIHINHGYKTAMVCNVASSNSKMMSVILNLFIPLSRLILALQQYYFLTRHIISKKLTNGTDSLIEIFTV